MIRIHIYAKTSSSSSSCRASSMDIPDPLSPLFPIVHRLRQVFRMLYFDPRPGPKMLFQGDTPEGSDTFQWPVIERDRVGGLRLMIWDKVKVPLCHYSDAPEESNL